ncbi:MAG: hypothetical protein F6K30_12305, partial [Cyanothece sp. SIO2G6]|nr:hypothetical protein [Cyanothece sp. SIO2G6]
GYIQYHRNGGKIIEEEDFFIVIEIGHWLINRDAGLDDYLDAKISNPSDGYRKALELYEILDPTKFRKELKYNFYASRGLAYAKLRQTPSAREDFSDAIRIDDSSSDLNYNFASMDAQLGNFPLAIKGYKTALVKYKEAETKANLNANEDFEVQVKEAIIYRDLGWAHLLLGMNKDNEPTSDGTRDFTSAIDYFNKITNSSNLRKESPGLFAIANVGKALALFYSQGSTAGGIEIQNALSQAGNTPVAQYAQGVIDGKGDSIFGIQNSISSLIFGNIVPHDLDADKTLDVFHGYFYCGGRSPRIQ